LQSCKDLRVTHVDDPKALETLADEWGNLAAACVTSTVFQTYEWIGAWWRHFGHAPGRCLHIVTFRTEDGLLVGLAPLMTSYWYATPFRRLSFIGTGASDYQDILALPGREADVAQAFYSHLASLAGWNICDLQQIRTNALLRHRDPVDLDGLSWFDVEQEPCPYLDLASSWDQVLEGLGKKTRSNVRYYDRSLEKVYEVDFGHVTTNEELGQEIEILFELHRRRWNQRWLPGVFSGKKVQNFHRDVTQALLERDWLRLFYLRLDGETQASLYCFSYGDRICYYQGGFEPSLAKLSLGTVLTARAMHQAVLEEKSVFDFLRGDEPYKAKWTGLAQVNVRRIVTKQGKGFSWLARRVQKLESHIEFRAKEWARSRK
jgi:CelD/BcsL family acetyltransferase involved in cellulose biosynthesis